MPIYEYRCSDCDQVFEALQRVSEAPLDACRRCGGPARRIISAPAIQFMGSGWYVTDYARKKGGDSSAKNGGGDPEASKKTKTPPAKSEPKAAKKESAGAAASGRGKPASAGA